MPVAARALPALLLVAAAAAAPRAVAEGEHPLCKDKTGMTWVLPFEAAREKAAADRRLLMIKPVAFGTSRDGGW